MTGKHVIHSSLRRAATRSTTHHSQPCRTFTSTRRHGNQGAEQGSARGMITRQMARERTMQSRISKAKGSEIPSDLGLFPETLIRPESKDLPSFFSSRFRRRLKIEWTAFWQKTRDFGGTIFQKKWYVKTDPITKKRLREPLYLAERYTAVRALHKELYTALAKGDRARISDIACTGLQQATRTRLDHRLAVNGPEETWSIEYKGWTPKSEKMPWLLQALVPPRFKSTQIVADRMGALPIGRDGKMRQVFAKIRSRQTLDKHDGKGPKTRDVEEYVVIQQMTIDGQEDKWRIWGTTQPSSSQQIDQLFNAQAKEVSFMDKMSSEMKL